MKTMLPWLVAALASAGAFYCYHSQRASSAEVARLRQEVEALETLRAEHEALKARQVSSEEISRLRKNTEELLRLRNETRQLRDAQKQLAQKAEAAQAETQRAQALAEAAQVQAAQAQAAQAQAQAINVGAQQALASVADACINQLRQLEAGKQQWALEHRKTAEAVPTSQDLAPYFKDSVLPKCPAGGNYTLNAVAIHPACSSPEHVLPQ